MPFAIGNMFSSYGIILEVSTEIPTGLGISATADTLPPKKDFVQGDQQRIFKTQPSQFWRLKVSMKA